MQTYAFVASYRFVRTGRIGRLSFVLPFTLALAFACLALPLRAAQAGDAEVARGKYLVSTNGCTDCHTPGHFFGKSDEARYLGGSDVGFAVPGLGVFVGPNLTPDNETGLGKWSTAEIVAAFTTGKAPDGRMLAPPMPWREYSRFTKSDAEAIAVYLKSLPPVQHQVPGPFSPTQTPTTFVMSILPGEVYAHLPHPAPPPPSASDTK